MVRAKAWKGSEEYKALSMEIKRHPLGTPAKVIFEQLLPETKSLLEEAGRTSGSTKEWSVYRQICKMLNEVSAPLPNSDSSSLIKIIEQIDSLEEQLKELKSNLKYLIKNSNEKEID